MTHQLIVSPEAEKDILAILEYTQQTWGIPQASNYLGSLEAGFEKIQNNPYMGRSRSDISSKHRSFVIKKHIAIYFIVEETVYLSRILHHSRDVFQHEIPS